jgi:hypothetical protein
MFELLGIAFGGASRLFQHWLEIKDKNKERDHEFRMFDKQLELMARKAEIESELRRMDYDAAKDAGELDALVTSIRAQADEARAAGGWVAQLSASVRPIISYWLLIIYTTAKLVSLYLTWRSGVLLAEAIVAAYTTFDGALLGSIMSFWFADRSLRKWGRY